jgi:hypothetical protein
MAPLVGTLHLERPTKASDLVTLSYLIGEQLAKPKRWPLN